MRNGSSDATVQRPVLQLVLFVIERQRYALELPAVERVVPMVAVAPLPQGPAVALGVVNVHGKVIPVLERDCVPGVPGNTGAWGHVSPR